MSYFFFDELASLLCFNIHPQLEQHSGGGGGGSSAYERDGDACGKFWIKPLKETDLGIAQAFLDP